MSLRAARVARTRFDPPDLSARAFEESAAERAAYEARFKSLNRPEFSNKFLDVDQVTRVLMRTRNRDTLCCELIFYTVLVVLYTVFLVRRVSPLTVGYNLGIGAHISVDTTLVTEGFEAADVSYLANTSNTSGPVPVDLSGLLVNGGTGNRVPAEGAQVRSGWCRLPYSSFLPSNGSFVKVDAADAPTAGNSSGFAPCLIGPRYFDYTSVRTIPEVYAWLRDIAFGPRMFPVNGTYLDVSSTPLGFPTNSTVLRVPVLQQAWIPMGAMRLRQVRVRSAPCDAACTVGPTCSNCSLPLHRDTITTAPFVAGSQTYNQTYNYYSAEELATSVIEFPRNSVTNEVKTLTVSSDVLLTGSGVMGLLAYYPGGGYKIDVEMGNSSAGREAFDTISKQRWIDGQTAALFVTYNLYSKDANSFASVSFLIEISPFGPILTSHSVNVLQLDSPAAIGESVALLVLSSLLLIYFLANIVADLRARSDQQVASRRRWALYDVLNLVLVIASIALRLATVVNSTASAVSAPSTALVLCTSQRGTYVDFFHRLSVAQLEAKLVSAISLVVCFLKFFKYVDLDKRFSIALNSIIEARRWLAGWLVLTLVLVLALTFYLQLSFGTFSPRFGGFGSALRSATLYVFQVFRTGTVRDTQTFVEQLLMVSDVVDLLPMVEFGVRSYPGLGAASAEPAFFLTLFALSITITVYGVFQAAVIFGYQIVAGQVLEEDNLAQEQRELVRRSRLGGGGVGWCTRARHRVERVWANREVDTIISRLRTAPETRFRNLLSFEEVLAIIEDAVQPQERAYELSVELMTIFQTPVSRIADAAVLFQERTQAIMQGRSSFEVATEDLPTITGAQSTSSFDPTARERWIQDLLSGDLVQSLLLVHCLQLEASEKAFLKRLRQLDALQDAVADETVALERAVEALETALRLRHGEAAKQDPWAPRRETAVEANQEGAFEAHHVDKAGTHRYLGSFTTRALAQQAIDKLDSAARPPQQAQREPGADTPAEDDGDGDGAAHDEDEDEDAASAQSGRSDR